MEQFLMYGLFSIYVVTIPLFCIGIVFLYNKMTNTSSRILKIMEN